jgi:hypothetical protein
MQDVSVELKTGEPFKRIVHPASSVCMPSPSVSAPHRLGCQAGRFSLPRYVITWSGHLQACVQGWPSRNRGVFPAVDHYRSRT